MITIDTERLPILVWADDLAGFEEAIEQAKNLANHPAATQHVALMPDFHVGYGMPIGGVLVTEDAIVPNAVGVDIGCGMIAMRTFATVDMLDKDMMQTWREMVHAAVPVGNGPHGNQKDNQELWFNAEYIVNPVIEEIMGTARVQMGTLGGGNHFIELQADEEGRVWLMVHSGSRGLGKQVCDYYDDIARGGTPILHNGRVQVTSPKKEQKLTMRDDELHAIYERGSHEFWPYWDAMTWCLEFAETNRHRMMTAASEALMNVTNGHAATEEIIETHHNYASWEYHDNKYVLVHRKGAVKAEKGTKLIIPGSMGTASYIAKGLGNALSFNTCSHGAGRVMGRKEANRTITHDRAVESMQHVVFGIRQGDYEEMPDAYKDIDEVMENQKDLVTPVHRLVPLAVVKG